MEPSNLATAHILQVRVKNREFLVRHYLKTLDAVYENRFLGGNARKFKAGPHLFSPLGKWNYGLLEPSHEATTHGTCPRANRVGSMPRLWYPTSERRVPMTDDKCGQPCIKIFCHPQVCPVEGCPHLSKERLGGSLNAAC